MSATPQFWTVNGVRRNTVMSGADDYSSSTLVTYNPGSWVWYPGDSNSSSGLYQCKTATTGGNWQSSCWTLMNQISKMFSDDNESLIKSMDYVIGSDNPADRTVVNLNDPTTHYLTAARSGDTALVIAASRDIGKLRDFAVVFTEPPTTVSGSPFAVNFRTTDSANNALTFKGSFITPEASATENTDYIYYLSEIELNVFLVKGEKLSTVTQS